MTGARISRFADQRFRRLTTGRKSLGSWRAPQRFLPNLNPVVIVSDFATLEGAQAFAWDPSLPVAMEPGGVEGAPQVWIVEESEAKQ
jgi:hypothetical protein